MHRCEAFGGTDVEANSLIKKYLSVTHQTTIGEVNLWFEDPKE